MPKRSVIQRRGGVLRIRTKKISPTKYIHIYVTRRKGKRGGQTVSSPVHRRKK